MINGMIDAHLIHGKEKIRLFTPWHVNNIDAIFQHFKEYEFEKILFSSMHSLEEVMENIQKIEGGSYTAIEHLLCVYVYVHSCPNKSFVIKCYRKRPRRTNYDTKGYLIMKNQEKIRRRTYRKIPIKNPAYIPRRIRRENFVDDFEW